MGNILQYTVKGQVILISEQDKKLFESHQWYLVPARQAAKKFYVRAAIDKKTVYFHRMIMNAEKGQVVDHKNQNTLDCTRDNLRIVTPSVNRLNSTVRINKKSSPYRGVYKNRHGSTFYCATNINGKRKHLGSFATAELASLYYEKFLEDLNK